MPSDHLPEMYVVRENGSPWRVVTRAEWVQVERRADFHNTMGRPDEPATAGFTSQGQGQELEGKIIYPTHYHARYYDEQPQLRSVIEAELAARQAAQA